MKKALIVTLLTLSLISTQLDAFWPFSSTPPTQEELNRQLWDEFSTDCCSLSKAEKLIKAGADVDTQGEKQWNYTLLAKVCGCLCPHAEWIEFLIDNGADINYIGGHKKCTPLHLIASQPTFPIEKQIEILIAQGAEVNARDIDGKTPLYWAGTEEAKALLKEHGGKTSAELNVIAAVNRFKKAVVGIIQGSLEIGQTEQETASEAEQTAILRSQPTPFEQP